MNGILCVDKPAAHTSFDVVARMRGIAKTRAIGHGGTLDPMATGVLPLFFGRAAKAVDLLPNQDKAYTATFKLGIITDTQDITGDLLERRQVTVGQAEVAACLAGFVGPQSQLPPMYSAVRVGGQRLYDLARQGREVARPPRQITIYSLRFCGYNPETAECTIEVGCSKGSYIRTLCHDIGLKLGCGGVLTALRRTAACGFDIGRCVTMERAEELAAAGRFESALLPVESAFAGLPRLDLDAEQTRLLRNGAPIALNRLALQVKGRVAVFGAGGFLGVAEPRGDRLRLVKLLCEDG